MTLVFFSIRRPRRGLKLCCLPALTMSHVNVVCLTGQMEVFFVETSAQWSSQWTKEVDGKVTVSTRRGPVVQWSSSSVPHGHPSVTLTSSNMTQTLQIQNPLKLLFAYLGFLEAHMKIRLNEICSDAKVFANLPLSFYSIVWNCHCKIMDISAATTFIMVFQSFAAI